MGIFETLGVTPVINATGYVTRLSGSLMLPEVRAAMDEASRSFVQIGELQDAASRIIAEQTGAEAGYVTSGAAAGLTLSAAACLAGTDHELINRLPDTTGIPNEIIIPAPHRDSYDRCLRSAGARLVTAGTADLCLTSDLERAITGDTVALAFFSDHESTALPLPDLVAVARANDLPVIVDAALALPPPENLRRFTAEGADLVVFSSGKDMRGPQSAGFVAGRADLIASFPLQHQDMGAWTATETIDQAFGPPGHGIGRGLKAGKEEITGALVALQRYPDRDHEAELAQQWQDAELVASRIADLPGISYEMGHKQTPGVYLQISFDPQHLQTTPVEITRQLAAGTPRIIVRAGLYGEPDGITVGFAAVQPGEAEIISNHLFDALAANVI